MIILAIVLVVALFAGACCIAGFQPPGTLDTFRSDGHMSQRRFEQPVGVVMAAYKEGARRTPGMRVVAERGSFLLVDLRPTSRILDGNFGMAIRLEFAEDAGHTTVSAEAKNKVPWSFTNHEAAFRHAERALRMNAKESAIDEVV